MKRMVKNGDLIDVEADGTITVAGKPVNGNAVEANPTDEATETLTKLKVGETTYGVEGGGGGSENDRVLTLTMPYASNDKTGNKEVSIDEETYQKISNFYYETIKLYYNDGKPIGVFNVLKYFYEGWGSNINSSLYGCITNSRGTYSNQEWYGESAKTNWFAQLIAGGSSGDRIVYVEGFQPQTIPSLSKAKFDALYKLADKPTQDGNYILKASVSGGVVTYTWELQQ